MTSDAPLTPDDFEACTNGLVHARTLHTWNFNGQWITPTPPNNSRPYPYRREHLAEAAIIARFNGVGLTQTVARAAMRMRLQGVAADISKKKHGRAAGVRYHEVQEAIFELPEFKQDSDLVWAVHLRLEERGSKAPEVLGVQVLSKTKMLSDLAGSCFVFPISEVAQKVWKFIDSRQPR